MLNSDGILDKDSISTLINDSYYQKIIQSEDFYFQLGQDKLNEFLELKIF